MKTSIHSRRWCKFFFLFAVISFSIPKVYAQRDTTQIKEPQNSLRSGAWALLFEVGSNFTLEAFQGFTISAKRHFSDKRALRLGLGISGSVSLDDEVIDRQLKGDTVTFQEDQEGDLNNESVDLIVQHLWYANPKAEVNFFFGVGPLLRFSHSKSETDATEISGGITTLINSTSKETRWTAGFSAVLGVEWFATKHISFLAEYVNSLEHEWFKRTTNYKVTTAGQTTEDRTEVTRRTLRFNPEHRGGVPLVSFGSVKFGLSVYF